jgi:hypothetical protein
MVMACVPCANGWDMPELANADEPNVMGGPAHGIFCKRWRSAVGAGPPQTGTELREASGSEGH